MASCSHDLLMCVTGASGYLGSWLIMRLLERGYRVRGTLRDLHDEKKAAHLVSLPGAKENLELVWADVLDEESLSAAVDGCDGVFGVAIPLPNRSADQGETIEPSIQAALNLMRACKKASSVRRVVMTSTYFAVTETATAPKAGEVLDESTWTSVEYCRETEVAAWGYKVGKTLAEKAAYEFAQKNEVDLVTILPSLVGGPFLPPSIPGSVSVFLGLMTELEAWMIALVGYMSFVHIEDVAQAHILLMEDSRAKGRYLCAAAEASLSEVAGIVSTVLMSRGLDAPKYARSIMDKAKIRGKYKISTKKLESLGFTYKFKSLTSIFQDTMHAFIDRAYL